MVKQRELLNRVAKLTNEGKLISTITANLGAISVDTLPKAHREQESGLVISKNVLEGFTK